MKICEGLDIPQVAPDAFDGWCVAYFQHEVLVGTVCGGNFRFVHEPNWDKLLEFHLFNEEREYRALWRNGKFVLRVIEDSEELTDDNTFVYDEAMMIIGNSGVSPAPDQAFLSAAEKGRRVALPSSLANRRVRIRNYMTFSAVNEADMPGCETMRLKDWRYAGFCEENEEVNS